MNKTLKNIDQEKILFFDIEDVRRNKELDTNSKEFELFRKKTRNRETDEYLSDQEVVEEYNKRGALKMCYTKIITIGVGFIKNGEVHIKALEGTEEEVIKQFVTISQSFDFLCGANVVAFDCPMIVNNGFRYYNIAQELPDRFNPSGKKPWDLKSIIDLQEIFKGTHYSSSSVDEMCYHFGIPSPKNDLDGSMVSEEYYNNGINKILSYVKEDVFACVNLFKRMRFEDIFTSFIDKNENFVKELTLLEKLNLSKTITEDNKAELNKILGKKRITRKEKEIILDIVKAALSDIDDDFGKIKNEKDIDELIKQLS